MIISLATDTPENSVASIIEFLKDEARTLDALFESPEPSPQNGGLKHIIEIASKTNPERIFQVTLWYRDSRNTGPFFGPFGNGDIDGGVAGQCVLRLCPDNWDAVPRTAPYRWAIFRSGYDVNGCSEAFLTESVLRKLLRHTLGESLNLIDAFAPAPNPP
jgi:hypothetical protein